MPRKGITEEVSKQEAEEGNGNNETENLNRLLAAVMNYLSDDEVEEIDVDFLLKNTEGLQQWWDQYRESNRKELEDEIKNSLSQLSLKELEKIHDKIKEKES